MIRLSKMSLCFLASLYLRKFSAQSDYFTDVHVEIEV